MFVSIVIHLGAFIVSAYALQSVDFKRLTRRGHEAKAQVLYFLSSMALAYLVAQFLLSLSVKIS